MKLMTPPFILTDTFLPPTSATAEVASVTSPSDFRFTLPHRQLILMVPVGKFAGPCCWKVPHPPSMEKKHLKREVPSDAVALERGSKERDAV